MTDLEINIAAAENHGYKKRSAGGWKKNGGIVVKDPAWLPDYIGDLNNMHEVEKTLNYVQKIEYCRLLRYAVGIRGGTDGKQAEWLLITATARQRAEAFLKTIGAWPGE